MSARNQSNGLTTAEIERLAVLAEELGSVSRVIGRILRHGYASTNPRCAQRHQISNRVSLQYGLGDVLCAISLLTDAGDLDAGRVTQGARHKAAQLRGVLQHQSAPVMTEEALEEAYRGAL
jgi:hypothetical protein